MIADYRVARHNDVMAEEAETLGWDEHVRWRRESGLAPITFKEWLLGSRRFESAPDYSGSDSEDLGAALEAAGW